MIVAGQDGQMVCCHCQQPGHMRRDSLETGIPGFRDNAVPDNGRTGDNTVHSSTSRYRPDESVSVSGSYTGTSHFTGRPERPDYG